MPEIPSALSTIGALAAAACLYGAVWRLTGGLDTAVRAWARGAPLVVLIPGLLYVSLVLAVHREAAEAMPAGPPGPAPGAAKLATRSAPVGAVPPNDGQIPSAVDMTRAAPKPEDGAGGEWDVVPVLYGTDRLRDAEPRKETRGEPAGGPNGPNKGGLKFVPRRIAYSSERAHRLELGRALVTVPAAHKVPVIERPFALRVPYFNVVVYQQAEDPRRHFTIKEIQVLPRDKFLAQARERLGAGSAFKGQALVFVHGYNTGFDEALYRTAQIAYDLQFDGAAFLYSWPSGGGSVIGYTADRESATQAEPYLKEFLALVVEQTGAKSVSVIAHSMGTLPLLNVLHDLGPSLPPGVRLNQIILAAPDIDRDVFANLAAGIKGYGRGITLYCSANDRAMILARQVAGGVPRAGDVPNDGPVIVPGIDTIDVSATSTDMLALNHSTYAEKSALLNDIGLLLQTGERPPERRIPILKKVHTARGDFWRYP